jgi:hypothetical protein
MKTANFLVFFFILLFTACQKENMDQIIPTNPGHHVDTIDVNPFMAELRSYAPDTLMISCVKIPLPLDLLQESGNIFTINTEEDLEAAEMLADAIVDFVYPFGAIIDSGPIEISNLEDLAMAIIVCGSTTATCADLDAHVLLFYKALNILTTNKYPFSIQYPVNLIVEGNPVVINNNDEYLPAIGGDPFRYLKTELVYPITITQFGRTFVLNSDEDVCKFHETLSEPCENKPGHIQFFFNQGGGTPSNCAYFINYPVNITFQGNTLNIQKMEDYLNVLNATPDAYDGIELIYPVRFTKFVDNKQVIIQNDNALCQYLNNCQ